MSKVLLVDGLNNFARCYAGSPLMNEEGQHIGGVTAFLLSLGSLVQSLRPDRCIVVWEGGGSSRRRAISPTYKEGRRPIKMNRLYDGDIPDTHAGRTWELRLLVETLRSLGVQQLYVPDIEADDAIGYLTRYEFKDFEVVISSSDHDYYQLVDDRVVVWSPNMKTIVTADTVKERYGVPTMNFCVARCFSGDGNDAVPGAPGIGMRTLSKRIPRLLLEEMTVDDVVSDAKLAAENSRVKAYNSIVEWADSARTNWRLMNLDMSALSAHQIKKIASSAESCPPRPNKMESIRLLLRHGIKTVDVSRLMTQLVSTRQGEKLS